MIIDVVIWLLSSLIIFPIAFLSLCVVMFLADTALRRARLFRGEIRMAWINYCRRTALSYDLAHEGRAILEAERHRCERKL